MAIDTVLAFFIVRGLWGGSWVVTGFATVAFLIVDLSLFGANVPKLVHGGWFPIAMAIIVFILLSTWKRGRTLLSERLKELAIPLDPFIEGLESHPPKRVPGTAIFLTTDRNAVPHALMHNLKHNKVLHERIVILTVVFQDIPHVDDSERVEVRPLGHSFIKVFVNYGFKDESDIPRALELCVAQGLTFNMLDTSFFLSRETLIPARRRVMALWREKLFIGMQRNATNVTAYFRIPTNRVVELGTQIEL